jgi:PHD/YefM family antitoxin component YafN of YafNO toxin-antitoxin module
MARIVSSSEVQNSFGAIAQWTEENREGVVVERRGKPTLAIISYEEYQYLQQLREEQRRREIYAELDAPRQKIRERTPELTAEDAYRLAGFSEEVIRETMEYDEKIARGEV